MVKVGVLVGSLRKQSISRKFADNIGKFFPETYEIEIIEIGHIPFYNQDLDEEDHVHESYQLLRDQVADKDAFVFITPEYNRSVPAVLKNALDVASRPPTENKWSGKPAVIISQSPGTYGGFGANHHLRQIMTAINVQVLQQPEIYIAQSAQSFGEDGKLSNERTEKFVQKCMDKFVEFVKKHQ